MVAATDEPRILFLEDEPVVALDTVMSLREHGFTDVTHVSTLMEAKRSLAEGAYDLAILDINIDGSSSLPLARDLHDRGVPLILASGYRPDDTAVVGIADAFLTKPYSARRLIRSIEAIGR